MNILMTGATGFIGKALSLELLRQGHQLKIVTRHLNNIESRFSFPAEFIQWDHEKDEFPIEALKGVDVIFSLAGENVAQRWSDRVKKSIYKSRVEMTHAMVQALNKNSHQVKVLVSASGIGFYGDCDGEELMEAQSVGADFLAQVCKDWELAAQKAQSVRVVNPRIGMVLGRSGGALEKIAPIFKLGLGAPLGSGQQWQSWIHIDDLVHLLTHCMTCEGLSGPINAVAPQPVTNKEFSRQLAQRLKTWVTPNVPKFMLKLLYGEMAEILLFSQKVIPAMISSHGFDFKFQSLEKALENIFPDSFCKDHQFIAYQWVPEGINEVFPFFTSEKNLEAITPPWLNFRVKSKTTKTIQEGTFINYSLKIKGWPCSWQSEILDWKDNESFVDLQKKGPYKKWHHQHLFEPLQGGTLLTDKIHYRLPAGVFGELLGRSMVKKDMNQIFSYRFKKIKELFNK